MSPTITDDTAGGTDALVERRSRENPPHGQTNNSIDIERCECVLELMTGFPSSSSQRCQTVAVIVMAQPAYGPLLQGRTVAEDGATGWKIPCISR